MSKERLQRDFFGIPSLRVPPGTAAAPYDGRIPMAWTTPILVEICIGLEINGYLPAEF
jgi:coenzyme PQQ precursor peptide PqqA